MITRQRLLRGRKPRTFAEYLKDAKNWRPPKAGRGAICNPMGIEMWIDEEWMFTRQDLEALVQAATSREEGDECIT